MYTFYVYNFKKIKVFVSPTLQRQKYNILQKQTNLFIYYFFDIIILFNIKWRNFESDNFEFLRIYEDNVVSAI